jgi:surface protein
MFYRPRESFGKVDVVRCNNFLMHAKGRALLVIVQDAGDAIVASGGRVVVSTNGSEAETVGALVRLILGEGLGTALLAKSASGRKPERQSEAGAHSDARLHLAELRRMRKMETRDLLRSGFGERERRFCARSRVHDLCEIVVLKDEQDIDISGIASGILKALREGEFGSRTPAQEAYLEGVLYEGQMHDPLPAEESASDLVASDLVAGLGEDLVHETYGHVEVWDVRECATLENAFKDVKKIKGRLDLTFWDTRKVGDMRSAFSWTSFDVDVSTWDVSAVTSMLLMFSNTSGFSGDVSEWDVSKVGNMGMLFRNSSIFNGDVSLWDVACVDAMDWMFYGARAFTQDLSRWKVGNVTNMTGMFEGAESFECDLGNWDVSKVRTMKKMFSGATSFMGRGVEKWEPAEGVDVTDMFANAPLVQETTVQWAENLQVPAYGRAPSRLQRGFV